MPIPLRDLKEAADQLARWLQHHDPSGERVVVQDLTGPSATGFSSDTLLFTARSGETRSERLVARLEPRGFRLFPSYDVGEQYRILDILGRHGAVPVPRVIAFEPDESWLGTPFYLMEQVEGRVPSDNPPFHQFGWVTELEPAQREQMWWSGVDAMIRVHAVPWKDLGLGFLDRRERGDTPLAQQLDYYDRFLSWGTPDRRRYPLLEAALDWLVTHPPGNEPVGFCWGDSRLSNQIFRDQRCVAVLDWEMATLGNPLQDLAWWITLDRCLSEGIDVPRLPGFPDRERTVRHWAESTGHRTTDLAYYEVFAALRFSVIMARLSIQLKHFQILPAESDMDVNNLGSVILHRIFEEVR